MNKYKKIEALDFISHCKKYGAKIKNDNDWIKDLFNIDKALTAYEIEDNLGLLIKMLSNTDALAWTITEVRTLLTKITKNSLTKKSKSEIGIQLRDYWIWHDIKYRGSDVTKNDMFLAISEKYSLSHSRVEDIYKETNRNAKEKKGIFKLKPETETRWKALEKLITTNNPK